MKINLPVTQINSAFPSGANLISTTDLKGSVTSANAAFCNLAGFTEEELIGKNHNQVRHPDMPVEAFADLWETVQSKNPWMGLVKNRCKNGDHYYVDAYVTPIFDGNEVAGYQSVRKEPSQSSIERAETLYRNLRENKKAILTKLYPSNITIVVKSWISAALVATPVLAVGISMQMPAISGLALVVFAISGVLGYLQTIPITKLSKKASAVADNPITQKIYTGRGDELGQIELALHAQDSLVNTILCRISQSGELMENVVSESQEIVILTTEGTTRQQEEVGQLATALNQMTTTVAEVARIAESTSQNSRDVSRQANEGMDLVKNSINDIKTLASAIDNSNTIINKLKGDCDSIGTVIEVISDIADQTNLLALNAAIEAARAGDQGRGFAVVADEVRTLASSTQESTKKISEVITSLQASANEAMSSMETAQSSSNNSVTESEKLDQAFSKINSAIEEITSMSEQVATASEQQSVATEEINRNVTAISDVANITKENGDRTAAITEQLRGQVSSLGVLVKQFTRS